MADTQPVPIEEILEKQAQGFNAANARALAYAETIQRLAERTQILQAAIQSPAWRRQAEQLDAAARRSERLNAVSRNLSFSFAAESGAMQRHTAMMTAQNRRREVMQAQARNQAQATDFNSGNLGKHTSEMTALNRQYELVEAHARNVASAEDLASGKYARHAAAVGALNRQFQQQQKQMARIRREEELTARYGRVGGFVARNEGAIRVAQHFGSHAMSNIRGMAQRGFQGTVEQNRANLAGHMLDREVAGVFKPLKDLETGMKMSAAKWMRGLNENQQNALMAGGVGLGGLLSLHSISSLASIANDIRVSARASAMAAGAPPLAGGIGGFSGAALKTAIPLMGGFMAQQTGYGALGLGVGGTYGVIRGGLDARAEGTSVVRGGIKGGLKQGALWAAGEIAGTAANHGEDYYNMVRNKGHSKVTSGLFSLANSVAETGASIFGQGDEFHRGAKKFFGYESEQDKAKRRAVTLDNNGFEDALESYDRLQIGVGMQFDPSKVSPTRLASGREMTSAEVEARGDRGPGILRTPSAIEAPGSGETALVAAIGDLVKELKKNTEMGRPDTSVAAVPISRPESG